MNSDELQTCLRRLGAVRCGGSLVAPCLRCQPTEGDAECYRLQVNPGASYPVLIFCVACCVPKPQTSEDRDHNRSFSRWTFQQAGCDLDAVYGRMEAGDIRRLWAEVQIGNQPVPESDRASDDELHSTYDWFLSRLPLSERHQRWLKKRGLDPEWAESVGYRTAPIYDDACDLAQPVREMKGVPGLTPDRWLTREGALLIPCRNRQGQVLGIKQRLSSDGRTRMRLLSGGGVKAAPVVHWPMGSDTDCRLPLWVTEGERKADAIYYHFRQPTVGLPGVGLWSRAVAEGVAAGCCVLALDEDDAGRRCTSLLASALLQRGVDLLRAKWPTEFKGVDDALAGGGKVEVVEWVPEDNGEGKGFQLLTPNLKSITPRRYSAGQVLKDGEIVDFLRAMGPTLRSEMKAHSPTISDLIRKGLIRFEKTEHGQRLEAVDGH